MNTFSKPHFLAIGPEKTGTSFLYALFREHPGVYVPPYKEIRFWNEGEQIPGHSRMRLLCSSHWHYRDLRGQFRKSVIRFIRTLGGRRLTPDERALNRWKLRFTIGRRGGEWYDDLFPDDDRLTGDISPMYYFLSKKRILDCHDHNPDTKIIIFARDPIERVFSKARMNLLKKKGKSADEFDMKTFRDFARNRKKAWIPYSQVIQRWRSAFSDVHVAVYDDLVADPAQWYGDICGFLGIEPHETRTIAKRINPGLDLTIPPACEELLFHQYGREILSFGREFKVSSWVERYHDLNTRFSAAAERVKTTRDRA